MLINFDNDIQWNLSPSYIFFVNNYFESVILVHESLCFEGHYVHWPFSLIKSPDPWGYQSLLPEAPYQIFHLCSLNWSEDCFNYCSERNNVVVVWNSQGAVFYSHQSEWLWFADCRHIFYFSQKKRHVKRKKQLVQDLIPPLSLYIHMCTLYTYTNICIPRFSPSGFFGPSRCLIPTPGLTSKYPVCAVCVCVCVYTHTRTHTLPPALKTEKTQTKPLSFLLSKMTPHAKQQALS